jgi:hypothetical protein
LEDFVDNGCARTGFRAAEGKMEVVEEPMEEIDRVGLFEEGETFGGSEGDFLEELVGRDVGFEGTGIVDLPDEDGESLGYSKLVLNA